MAYTARPLSPERAAALLAKPAPAAPAPTKFSRRTDASILKLDLDPSLSPEDAKAVAEEMSRRSLYGN